MKTVWLVTIAAATVLATPALAAHWTVDKAKSHVGFTVQWGGEAFSPTFKSWNADINFDPNNLASSHVAAIIDLASEASDSSDNDDGLKGPQGFSVSQFPTAKFESNGFSHRAGSSYVAKGTLSLHGVSRPVTLPFTLVMNGNTAHMSGKAQVLRTEFGLGQGEWASAETIAHEVTITVDLTATSAR